MARTKQGSKRKRRRTALVLGAAGVSFTMAGSASATAPATNVPSQNTASGIVLVEEEISDVSLATFYVFDKENESPLRQGLRLRSSWLRRRRRLRRRGSWLRGWRLRGSWLRWPWLCGSWLRGSRRQRL